MKTIAPGRRRRTSSDSLPVEIRHRGQLRAVRREHPPHPAGTNDEGDDEEESDGAGQSAGTAKSSSETKKEINEEENSAPEGGSADDNSNDAGLKTARPDPTTPSTEPKSASTDPDEDDDDKPYSVRSRDI